MAFLWSMGTRAPRWLVLSGSLLLAWPGPAPAFEVVSATPPGAQPIQPVQAETRPPDSVAGPAFTIVNGTSETATAVHAAAATRPDPGPNRISGSALAPGGAITLTPRADAGCAWRLRMVLQSGRSIELNPVDICQARRVVFTAEAPQPPRDRRETIRRIQQGLAALGYDVGTPDGESGPRTRTAVVGFQLAQGVNPDGILDEALLARIEAARAAARPPGAVTLNVAASGSGFVAAPGVLATNQHVIDNCARVDAILPDASRMQLRVLGEDRGRDLAALVPIGEARLGPPLPFRSGPRIRRGDEVVTYGYPLANLLSSGPTLTTGEISALSGLRDDPSLYQISAPVQAGNSGGPLLDRSGHVVGIVVAKLAALRVSERIGDLPQNVNFAVRGEIVRTFLAELGIAVLQESSEDDLSAADVGEAIHPSVVMLQCLRPGRPPRGRT